MDLGLMGNPDGTGPYHWGGEHVWFKFETRVYFVVVCRPSRWSDSSCTNSPPALRRNQIIRKLGHAAGKRIPFAVVGSNEWINLSLVTSSPTFFLGNTRYATRVGFFCETPWAEDRLIEPRLPSAHRLRDEYRKVA